ncbi:MAG: hypothetical protein LUD27_07495, partial [Clostridia bacterium]|nr:hypothetical protein [Clostridia bacterium]
MKKALRFLLYVVIFLAVVIAFALIAANCFNDFGNKFIDCIICGIFCFAGSIFFILGYDTLFHEDASKKGFFQKLFIAIGVILTIVCGVIEQIFYIGKFNDAQSYSPWLFALAAPAFMAQLLTLLMYETKAKNSNWIIKFLLPFISIIVCYFVYVILGYIG